MTDQSRYAAEHPAKILIVDDHPLVRAGLELQISSHGDLRVCGQASDTNEALSIHEQLSPDLIIVDLTLKTGHGLDLIREIRRRDPAAKMLVLSAHEESLFAERALRAGAGGYINKQEAQTKIIEAIRTVLRGKRYLSPRLTQRIAILKMEGESLGASPTDVLTDRELQVFQLIGEGKTTSAIAGALRVSVHTIESHRDKIRHRLGLNNAAELVTCAIQFHLEGK